MKNLGQMMKQAQQLQTRMQEMQQELEEMTATGTAGGGMVEVTLSGKGELKGIRISPDLWSESDAEMTEDLIVAAHNDARAKVETTKAEKMAELTDGLPLPPGMQLPF